MQSSSHVYHQEQSVLHAIHSASNDAVALAAAMAKLGPNLGGVTRPVGGTHLPQRIILATMAAGFPTAWAIAVNPLGVPYIVRLMCLVSCENKHD